MNYRNLGSAGVKVSPICLGTMMFGGQTDEATSTRIMHKALDLGVNFFDTANMYNAGQSEVVVGRAIADRRTSHSGHQGTPADGRGAERTGRQPPALDAGT